MNYLGKNLALLRKNSNESIEQLAKAVKTTKETIANIESGKEPDPKASVALRLAKHYAVAIHDLLYEELVPIAVFVPKSKVEAVKRRAGEIQKELKKAKTPAAKEKALARAGYVRPSVSDITAVPRDHLLESVAGGVASGVSSAVVQRAVVAYSLIGPTPLPGPE
jgi:transcriptional regulator with XRE-family HTH domain